MPDSVSEAGHVVDKEMTISHTDFRRILEAAKWNGQLRFDGRSGAVIDGARRLEITLSPERRRKIGLFDLPVTDVRLTLVGYDAAAAEHLLSQFDRAFQRGGG